MLIQAQQQEATQLDTGLIAILAVGGIAAYMLLRGDKKT